MTAKIMTAIGFLYQWSGLGFSLGLALIFVTMFSPFAKFDSRLSFSAFTAIYFGVFGWQSESIENRAMSDIAFSFSLSGMPWYPR